jgi:hypothetical protein
MEAKGCSSEEALEIKNLAKQVVRERIAPRAPERDFNDELVKECLRPSGWGKILLRQHWDCDVHYFGA